MKNHNTFDILSMILLVIGGLNWGIIGLFNVDLIDSIFGAMLSQIIFVVVGLAAVYRAGLWAASRSK